jgi:hypothetical protein
MPMNHLADISKRAKKWCTVLERSSNRKKVVNLEPESAASIALLMGRLVTLSDEQSKENSKLLRQCEDEKRTLTSHVVQLERLVDKLKKRTATRN